MSTEERLDRIERTQVRILRLLEQKQPEWMTETEATSILQRSKSWLKLQRHGYQGKPAALVLNKDWRYINGRTPEYRISSIQLLKKGLVTKQVYQ